MKYLSFFVLTLAAVFFSGCVTSGYTSSGTGSQNTTGYTSSGTGSQDTKSIKNTNNRTGNIIAYILEYGEKLSTFIETQNDLNGYAKHENEPTEKFYKEKFTEFENSIREPLKEEFQQKIPDTSFDNLRDMVGRIGFFYKIEYNQKLKVWHIELIGRSTTLRLDFANTRREEMSYYHRVVPYVNRWMELNYVNDLDACIRIYINDIDDESIPEFLGVPIEKLQDIIKEYGDLDEGI
jgi:hypothetical protein